MRSCCLPRGRRSIDPRHRERRIMGMSPTSLAVRTDYRALKFAELAEFSDFLHDLSDEQWDAPSLCEGWKVRDVVSHLTVGYTYGLPTIAGQVIKFRGSVPKGSDH